MDTVGRNKKIIAEYIRNQLEEDYAADQMSIKEYVDPFTGDKNKKAKKDSRLKRLPEMVMRCQTFRAPFRGYGRNSPFQGLVKPPVYWWL